MAAERLPSRLIKLGRWWDNNAEIDLVGIGEKENLFCEVKWSDNVDASELVHKLKAKAAGVGLHGKSHFCVIARSFKKEAPGALHLDLKKIKKLFLD